MKVLISLNGTDKNPYTKMGFKRNPFPAIPDARYAAVNDALARLGSECLTGPDDIRRILAPVVAGKSGDQLVEHCCERFKLGSLVTFHVTFPEN